MMEMDYLTESPETMQRVVLETDHLIHTMNQDDSKSTDIILLQSQIDQQILGEVKLV